MTNLRSRGRSLGLFSILLYLRGSHHIFRMQAEAFWTRFVTLGIEAVADEVVEFFQTPISKPDYEAYEWSDLVLDFIEYHRRIRGFEKIADLSEGLRQHNPHLFEDIHAYLHDPLTDYYCFKRDEAHLEEVVAQWIAQPIDFNILLLNLKKMLYYGYTEAADAIICEKFEEVMQDEMWLEGAEMDLAELKHSIELERFCVSLGHAPQEVPWDAFQQKMTSFGFDYPETFLEVLTRAIRAEDPRQAAQALAETFPSERAPVLDTLGHLFQRWMQEKQVGFSVSGPLWRQMNHYWNEFNRKPASWSAYFKLDSRQFDLYVERQSIFLLDNRPTYAMILWGSSYVADFLHEAGFLRKDRYSEQKKLIADLKATFQKNYTDELWQWDFVHDWLPPEGVSAEAWAAEKEAFKQSFDTIPTPRSFLPSAMGKQKTAPSKPRFEPPYKIGRNDKVSVKYADGTVKTDVKYKKVLPDLEAGKCELM